MTTSVVIPVYNGQKYLDENLPSVLALGADEVIVVDDASAEPIKVSGVKIIRHSKNTGFPISVNDGFKAAKGEIVILLNQDVLPDKNLLKFAMPHFKDPQVFAVTFNEKGRSWAKAEIKNGFLEYSNGPLDDQLHESFWASGATAAFRKSIWNELSGLDPAFSPGYFEDLDLGWRAHNRGYKIIWDSKALATHSDPESTFNKSYGQARLQRIKDRNYLLAHWKNLPLGQLPIHLLFLLGRILSRPGYLLPTLMAITRMIMFDRSG